MIRIAVLGSTGSIGTSCLDVIRSQHDQMSVTGLTAHRRWSELASQAREFRPARAVVADPEIRSTVDPAQFANGIELLYGADAVEQVARDPDTDVVVAAIVGAAGLRGTWAAVESGKRVAIANKETLVVAGPLVRQAARDSGSELIPVDSEHSAIFQALKSGQHHEVRRVILTASGGPFRGRTARQLREVTPEQAMAHPTWDMGPKITVDSATMMNKALEVIEAKWLFDLEADQIQVVVHPQSIIHSLVEFVDGSVIAQLSPPDMKLPIQYALTFPERKAGISPRLDWTSTYNLELIPPDLDAFPALKLGFEVARTGGSSGAVLNAANEIAVERFLARELTFPDIPRACRAILDAHHFSASPSLDELVHLDAWARSETHRWTP